MEQPFTYHTTRVSNTSSNEWKSPTNPIQLGLHISGERCRGVTLTPRSLLCRSPLRSLLKVMAAHRRRTVEGEDHPQGHCLFYNLVLPNITTNSRNSRVFFFMSSMYQGLFDVNQIEMKYKPGVSIFNFGFFFLSLQSTRRPFSRRSTACSIRFRSGGSLDV